MHKEYMLSCFNLNKMEDEEDFFESIDEMKSYIEQGGENISVLIINSKITKLLRKIEHTFLKYPDVYANIKQTNVCELCGYFVRNLRTDLYKYIGM